MTDMTLPLSDTARHEIMGAIPGRWHPSSLWRNFKARRKVRALADLENNMLDDIGITRTEIAWAARLPLTVNAAILLDQRARARRQSVAPARIRL